jgi:hypothetical protein
VRYVFSGGGEVGPALGEIAIVAAVIPCLDEEDTIGNLGQRGNPAARIKKKEVTAAFGKQRPKK